MKNMYQALLSGSGPNRQRRRWSGVVWPLSRQGKEAAGFMGSSNVALRLKLWLGPGLAVLP